MASTYTTNLSLRKPEHRDPDTVESWDAVVNNNMEIIDTAVGARTYTEDNYIHDGEALATSLNALDMNLKDVANLAPDTADKHNALAGAGTPSGANPYTTKSYVDGLTQFVRKMVLFPEFVGATFTEGSGAAHTGTMTTDVELTGTNFLYNYYKWLSSEGTLQKYDIVCQFRIPESFVSLATNKCIVVDLCTEEIATTNNAVDVTVSKDGVVTTASTTGNTSAVAATWASEREGSSVAYFDAVDVGALAFAAGSTVNVRITMYSQASKYVKLGAITFQYTG